MPAWWSGCRLEGSDKELVLINLHLEAYDDGDAKQIQTEELLKLLTTEYEKGNYCIAGGDFNQTFSEVDATKYPLIDSSYWQAGTLSSDILPEAGGLPWMTAPPLAGS